MLEQLQALREREHQRASSKEVPTVALSWITGVKGTRALTSHGSLDFAKRLVNGFFD
jgi:hypothetical protein